MIKFHKHLIAVKVKFQLMYQIKPDHTGIRKCRIELNSFPSQLIIHITLLTHKK